jgi:hypothetical protein
MKSVMAELAIFFQARRIEGTPHSSSAYSSATALTIPHTVDVSPNSQPDLRPLPPMVHLTIVSTSLWRGGASPAACAVW